MSENRDQIEDADNEPVGQSSTEHDLNLPESPLFNEEDNPIDISPFDPYPMEESGENQSQEELNDQNPDVIIDAEPDADGDGGDMQEDDQGEKPQENQDSDDGQRRELAKFMVLVLVLFGTVAMVALITPLIFGNLVPSILGLESLSAPMPVPEFAPPPEPTEAPAIEPESESTPSTEFLPAVESDQPATGAPEQVPTQIPEPYPPPSEEETASETASETEMLPLIEQEGATTPTVTKEITHTVQAGETLYRISISYGISVEAIAAANHIINPQKISAGTVLVIPKP